MARPKRFTTAQVELALEQSAGLQSLAAAKLGCHPNTIAAYLKRSARLRKRLAEIEAEKLDLAESQLLTAIREGNMTGVIFYLKTKGKHRGYSERTELTGPGGAPLSVEDSRRRFHERLADMRQSAEEAAALEDDV